MDGDISDDDELDELVFAFTHLAAEAVQLAIDGGPELAQRACNAEGAADSRCGALIHWAATNGFTLFDGGTVDYDEFLEEVVAAEAAAKKSAANRKKKEQKRRSRQRQAAAVTVIQAAGRGWACRRRLSHAVLTEERARCLAEVAPSAAASARRRRRLA